MFIPSYFEGPLKQTRARQLELLRRNAHELSGQEQLATVDLLLAELYCVHGRRQDVARPLFNESIMIWQACIAPRRGRRKGSHSTDDARRFVIERRQRIAGFESETK
jgi:hypothetical protein